MFQALCVTHHHSDAIAATVCQALGTGTATNANYCGALTIYFLVGAFKTDALSFPCYSGCKENSESLPERLFMQNQEVTKQSAFSLRISLQHGNMTVCRMRGPLLCFAYQHSIRALHTSIAYQHCIPALHTSIAYLLQHLHIVCPQLFNDLSLSAQLLLQLKHILCLL